MAVSILDEFLILFRTRLTGDGIQRVNKQLGKTRNSLFKTSNLFKTFFAYDMYGAVRNLIPSMIDVAKKMGAMEARFYAVTGSTKLAREELSFVKAEADRLGLTFLDTADNYSIFYASVKNTLGSDTARNIFTNWAESFRILHIDPARQERILYALREMASKGKIYMQDLANQLGSHVPDAMGIAAKSMGYFGKDAVNKFRADITAGRVDVHKFLVTFSSAINGTYVSAEKLANAMNKPDAQLATLANRWQSFQIAFSEGGFERDLVGILKTLNSMLPVLEKIAPAVYGILKLVTLLIGLNIAGKIALTAIKIGQIIYHVRSLIGLIKLINVLLEGSAIWGAIVGGGPVAWGMALIVGLGMALGFILHKFFPNVEKALMGMWNSFKTDVVTLMYMVENWLMSLPFASMFSETNGGGPTASQTKEKWNKQIPNYSSIANTGAFFENFMRYAISGGGFSGARTLYGKPSNVKITNNVYVTEPNATPEQIADKVSEKQSKSFGQKIKEAIGIK